MHVCHVCGQLGCPRMLTNFRSPSLLPSSLSRRRSGHGLRRWARGSDWTPPPPRFRRGENNLGNDKNRRRRHRQRAAKVGKTQAIRDARLSCLYVGPLPTQEQRSNLIKPAMKHKAS